MARKWSNQDLPGALHFVTGNVLNRLPVFRRESACQVFLEKCQQLRSERECKLIAFVLMPDHFHLIANPRDGKIRESIGALKSLSSKGLIDIASHVSTGYRYSHQIWQESFKAIPLWSGWMIWQKINYIYSNPVRAKLVKSAKDCRWSSFRAFYSDECEPLLQVDKDWWRPDDVQKLKSAMAELAPGSEKAFKKRV